MSNARLWRVIEVTDDPQDTDLTDSELVGISVLMTHHANEPHDAANVYWRARQKLQPQVQIALGTGDEE